MSISTGGTMGWLVLGMACSLPLQPAFAQTNRPGATPLPLPPTTVSRPLPNPANRVVIPATPPRTVSAPPVVAPAFDSRPFTPAPLISPLVAPVPAPPPITTGLPELAIAPAGTSSGEVDAVLNWDAEVKEHKAQPGETSANYTFWLTNVSLTEVQVNRVSTSCGCTVAQLPSQPWPIQPGGSGPIHVTLNMVGKAGLITKGVTVDTTVGTKRLTVKADIPVPSGGVPTAVPPVVASGMMNDTERMQNMQLALADL